MTDDICIRYERAVEKLRREEEAINQLVCEYGQLQLNIISHTVERFVAFIRSNNRQASLSEKQIIKGVEFLVAPIPNYKALATKTDDFDDFTDYLKGGVKAATAAAKYGGVPMLAWLGGGSLAAGGGGVVLGALVLGGVAVIPALAIGGIMLNNAMDESAEYEAKVNKIINDICQAIDYSPQLKKRIIDLISVLESLNNRAVSGLNQIESQPFDSNRDAEKFQEVAISIKGIVEMLKTPVLNSEGKLNLGTVTILEKYHILPGK